MSEDHFQMLIPFSLSQWVHKAWAEDPYWGFELHYICCTYTAGQLCAQLLGLVLGRSLRSAHCKGYPWTTKTQCQVL